MHSSTHLGRQPLSLLTNSRASFVLKRLLVAAAIPIVIMGVLLSGLELSSHIKAEKRLKLSRARLEVVQLEQAIEAYKATYAHFPVSSNTLAPRNSDVMAILRDTAAYPDGRPTVNAEHKMNPLRIRFLDAFMSVKGGKAGIGPDLVYRDPWGSPYVISMDLNGQGRCLDGFYRLQSVSQQNGSSGYFGLTNTVNTNGNSDFFSYSGQVMVWSLGRDGKADPKVPADQGANKDNILSWK
jgi:hypothetical protein